MHTDPVCGMPLEAQQAAGRSTYRGLRYVFCSSSCTQEFDRQPERYAATQPRSVKTAS